MQCKVATTLGPPALEPMSKGASAQCFNQHWAHIVPVWACLLGRGAYFRQSEGCPHQIWAGHTGQMPWGPTWSRWAKAHWPNVGSLHRANILAHIGPTDFSLVWFGKSRRDVKPALALFIGLQPGITQASTQHSTQTGTCSLRHGKHFPWDMALDSYGI